jgi:ABC-2 type transport system permease protein
MTASVDAAIGRRAFTQIWKGATAWGLVFGATAAASALSYVQSFPTAASRHEVLVTTSGNGGLTVLLGSVSSIDTVGGYTVYKTFVFLTTIGAIWAMLSATRLLRREEDTGRWQLMLTGGTRPSRATAATLTALGAATAIILAGTTAITALAGRDSRVAFGIGESVLYGLSMTIPIAVFAGVGAVTSQLGRTRRTATALASGVFAVTFVVRMLADSGESAHWLRWATPFGWTELVQPFTRNNLWPLVPSAVTVVVLGLAAAALASRRDVGSGVFASRDVSSPRRFGLRSPTGLVLRLDLAVIVAWCAGAAATAFAFGIIVKVTTGNVPSSLTDTLDKFGVKGSFANQYFGVAFLLVATVVALFPASQIGSASDDETSGRLVHVLAQPTRRTAAFGARLLVSATAVAVGGLLGGLTAGLGAKTQGIDFGFARMLGAGLNVVPTALVALGVGALALAIAPRHAASAVYAVVLWSLIVDLLSSMVSGLSGLDRVSLFHYMALAPAQAIDTVTVLVTLAVAVALCGSAAVLFGRRDLQTA